MSSKIRTEISLKKVFLKRFILGALVVWCIVSVLSYFVIRHELDELYDGELAQTARIFLGIYGDEIIIPEGNTRVTSSPFEGGENYERKLVFQIWDDKNNLLMRSANAPLEALSSSTDVFQTQTIYGNKIRTLSIKNPNSGLMVQVGQNIDFRRKSATEALEPLIVLLLVALAISILLIHGGLNKGLQYLRSLSQKISQRTGDDLSPIEAENIPTEIMGIVDALNKLMKRVNDTFTRERQFIADAAHELRTPLAGIKAQAQVALKDQDHREKSLANIVEGVDRTTRLANQLLTLSGVESLLALENTKPVEIEAVINSVLRNLSASISDKSLVIGIDFKCTIKPMGDESLLYTLFRNIIDNAVKYAPEHSEIKIFYRNDEDSASVSISDQGPGITVENRERVFDRFYRQIENQEQGSGLGLAISKTIATLHHANITFFSSEGEKGITAVVTFESTAKK